MSALLWLKDNWRLVLFLALMAFAGAQSYRLLGAQGQVSILTLEKSERQHRDAVRALAAQRNKERTDEEYTAARRRFTTVVVRGAAPGVVTAAPVQLAPGGAGSALCFDRGKFSAEFTGFAERHAARLTRLLADVSQRDDERLTAVAREGEELAAAYRACRAYTLNLAGEQEDAPGEAGNAEAVGGGLGAPTSPAAR